MRIISGSFKGKRLYSPEDKSVRPTTDRIKETIFNILNSRNILIDGVVLDLFAGSGALGLEALSRGAQQVIFADTDNSSIKLINANLNLLGVKCPVFNSDYMLTLKKLAGMKFDLIILDPPYALKPEKEVIELILKYDLLNPNGIIFIEHSKDNCLINLPESFIIDTRECGNTLISFLSYTKG